MELKKRSNKSKKQNIELPLSLFKKLAFYMFSEYVNIGFLRKLNLFFNEVNLELYRNDVDIAPYFEIVYRYIDIRLLQSIVDEDAIISYILEVNDEVLLSEITELFSEFGDVTSEEAVYVENQFINRLNFITLDPIIHQLKTLVNKYVDQNYDSHPVILEEIKQVTSNYTKNIHSKSAKMLSIPDLDFNEPDFFSHLSKINKYLKDEQIKIKSGIKRLNASLGGGFQPGRVYIFLGLTGGFKSGILLNIFLWAAKFNQKSICRDKSKKPAYIYITQENDLEETVSRMYSYIGSASNGRIIDNDTQIIDKLSEENLYNPDTHGLILKYRPKFTICAVDIENMVNEINAGGEYEVRLIIHDYLKRLRPNSPTGDVRIDLGEATNDLSELAKALKIPVVTGNQVNREAYKTLMQSGQNSNKSDLGRGANATMQSESALVTENADAVYVINKEYSSTLDQWFLTFTDIKNRASTSNHTIDNKYFAVPFADNNSMRLKEDFDLDIEYAVDSIAGQLEDYDPNTSTNENDSSTSSSNRKRLSSTNKATSKTRKNIDEIADELF